MSKIITLDAIREAADKKYGSTIIPVGEHRVELLNPLRMEKAKRDELIKLQETLNAEPEEGAEEIDQEQVIDTMFRLIAKTEGQANKLIAALDLAERVTVFELYQGEAELGEASDSQD
jgi:hypothetical protein